MAKRRRGTTTLSGIIAVDKPPALSSHDVVARLRSLTGEGRIGHAGTLDPLATGLLLVCIGPATRLAPYLMANRKAYTARIVFGTTTTTDDAQGEVLTQKPVPPKLAHLPFAASCVAGLVGEHDQLPPRYSAVKKGGVKAYEAARRGTALDLDTRRVTVYEAALELVGEGYWDVHLTVSKGTYIRSLARDMGAQLACGAHIGALRRTHCGPISLKDAFTLDELQAMDDLTSAFLDPVQALGLPSVAVDGSELELIQNGRKLPLRQKPTSSCAQPQSSEENTYNDDGCCASGYGRPALYSLIHDNRLVALYQGDPTANSLVPHIVIPGGVSGVR
ncbi:MAG: tRNA pseudouridine(55) synthase TruB [Coriobacteriales bacterium]|jgi:tRNA pseudouridine55 synthase|nr:tRNA pseudouridine(55) synthase TruB [Coriobacteriales bacterium]